MTRPDIEAMELLEDKATQGPWWWGCPADDPRSREERAKWLADALSDGDRDLWTTWTQTDRGVVIPALTGDGPTARENAEFIAAARTFIPEVIAYVRELEARLTDYEGALGFSDDGHLYPEGDVSEKCICPGGHR